MGILQITDATAGFVRVRILVSAADSASLFDLRCLIREELVLFLQQDHPTALPHVRLESLPSVRPADAASDAGKRSQAAARQGFRRGRAPAAPGPARLPAVHRLHRGDPAFPGLLRSRRGCLRGPGQRRSPRRTELGFPAELTRASPHTVVPNRRASGRAPGAAFPRRAGGVFPASRKRPIIGRGNRNGVSATPHRQRQPGKEARHDHSTATRTRSVSAGTGSHDAAARARGPVPAGARPGHAAGASSDTEPDPGPGRLRAAPHSRPGPGAAPAGSHPFLARLSRRQRWSGSFGLWR